MKAIFKEFEVKATFKGDKKATWMDNNFNNHMVKITNTETKTSTSFEFWGSIVNPELSTEYDVLNAFNCFVSDAIAGHDDFKEFCGNMGYDEDSRQARSTWRACQRAYNKLKRIYNKDIYDLSNELQEVAN